MRKINALELLFLTKRLKESKYSKIKKVKLVSTGAISLELYKEGKKEFLIIVPDKGAFLTSKKYDAVPPTNFRELLRKRLAGKRILDVRQHEFDRILEVEIDDHLLTVEFFGDGNAILIDKDGRITSALRQRSWKDRVLRPGRKYAYPPSPVNPFELTLPEFKKFFGKKEVVKVLAKDFGFGGEVAEKICEKLDINKNSRKFEKVQALFDFLGDVELEFDELKDVNDELKAEFNRLVQKVEGKKRKRIEEKFKRIKRKQLERSKELRREERKYREFAERIYRDYSKFDRMAGKMSEMRIKKKSWKSISKELKIKISPRKSTAIVDGVPLNYRKSLKENANIYFEKAKEMKKKLKGVKRAMKEMEEKKIIEVEKVKLKERKPRKEWYENFRWFVSSDDFLVVAGKDARSNEKLIRKYMKPDDLVFHADITGSPFALIKNLKGEEIPHRTMEEAAEFCGSYSKAWKVGIGQVDVYCVKPHQVKKEGGLPTGSFMIYGKREWFRRIPVRMVIGVKDDEVLVGPLTTIKMATSKYSIVVPGEEPAHELAKRVSKKLGIKDGYERISRAIPYGRGQIL